MKHNPKSFNNKPPTDSPGSVVVNSWWRRGESNLGSREQELSVKLFVSKTIWADSRLKASNSRPLIIKREECLILLGLLKYFRFTYYRNTRSDISQVRLDIVDIFLQVFSLKVKGV